MPRYYFNLKDRCGFISDTDGTELHDEAAAQRHAGQVARELMRHREAERRSWRVQVCDTEHRVLCEVLFADVDDSLDHLAPQLKASVKDVYAKTGRVADTINDVRATINQLKGTLARADGLPWLATLHGRRL